MMIDVCSAVQHAHQKGIIHRDLKPSNILVAQYDDRPVPKVIDFGVAKATHQKLTEKTLFTQLGQIVGTLEYMSPEQAVLNQLDVDTRTDVYSLGVVLYELLVGETPINGKELRRQLLDTSSGIVDTSFNNYKSRLRFISGGTEDAFLSAVEGSLTGRCLAHYLVGLRLRALGDNRCFDHFQQCVETKQIWMWQYHFSKTILLREGKTVPSILASRK